MKSMTKLAVAMLAMGCLSLGIPQAQAAATDSIAVTVTLDTIISVSVDVSAWAIGAKTLSATALSDLVTATNDGNVTEKFMIKGANGGGGWALGAAAGADQFSLGFDLTAPYETFVAIDTTGVVLAAPVARAGAQTFKMQYGMPTSDTKGGGVGQGFDITVTASVP